VTRRDKKILDLEALVSESGDGRLPETETARETAGDGKPRTRSSAEKENLANV